MSTYYFATFESRSKTDTSVKTVFNVILKDVHPVIWLSNAPALFRAKWIACLLFWSEISEDVAIDGGKYIPIEGAGSTFGIREVIAKSV